MGNGRTLKVAVLECERLQEHLAPAVYARTGGYLQLLQQAFTHVYAHASSILHPQINVPPQLSFTGGCSILSNYSTNSPSINPADLSTHPTPDLHLHVCWIHMHNHAYVGVFLSPRLARGGGYIRSGLWWGSRMLHLVLHLCMELRRVF